MIVFSPDYFVDFGEHVFPVEKYRLVFAELQRVCKSTSLEVITSIPATREQILQVHSKEYLQDLEELRLTKRTAYSEIPLIKEVVDMFVLASGGTIQACEAAIANRWAFHIGGGFHHAFRDRAEGFCYLNDLAIGVREMQNKGLIERAMIIDCDLHQGNGTAKIFEQSPEVFTFSIHQNDLYPIKEESDLDIHLPIGITDEDYLDHLHSALPQAIDSHKPELILYQAGADPYREDMLGDLKLTINGLAARDRYVFQLARDRLIPIAATLGGGYAFNTRDTVSIHVNTCLQAMEAFKQQE